MQVPNNKQLGRLILFAPNIHTGGGVTLLRSILAVDQLPELVVFSDARAIPALRFPPRTEVYEVKSTVFDRIRAQWTLLNLVGQTDILLCLQGMPPMFKIQGRVIVFHQNRLVCGHYPLSGYPIRSRIQIMLNRWFGCLCKKRVATYFVQTPSMRHDLENSLGKLADIRVMPFADLQVDLHRGKKEKLWDFLYVADGMPHKNHLILLEAWCLLASEGLRPSLALTLGHRDAVLIKKIKYLAAQHQLAVHNLGYLEHEKMLSVYQQSRALMYASKIESFGLPLIEADHLGLPIIASERDYVRDVCTPQETFDPQSPLSIARAVHRFLGHEEQPVQVFSAADFIREVCR